METRCLQDARLQHVLVYILANSDNTNEERLVRSCLLTDQFVFFPPINDENNE